MKSTLQFKRADSVEQLPMSLLLLADPNEEKVRRYLQSGNGFVAQDGEKVVGVCVVVELAEGVAEIMNIAVDAELQGHGAGSRLLRFVLDSLQAQGKHRVELGTGSFGYQLAFYQRLGFRVDAIWKNFFLENYAEPVIEDGLRHKDMLRLAIEFPENAAEA